MNRGSTDATKKKKITIFTACFILYATAYHHWRRLCRNPARP
jgi:hypothetical protein